MTKMIEATCTAGQVTAEGKTVQEAQVLSEGQGESAGVLLIEGPTAKYLTSNATDLKTTIDKLVTLTNKLATIITAIGAGMTGPTTAPPPTLAADVLELTSIAGELTTLKGQLK